MRQLDTAVATVLALEAVRDEHQPTRIDRASRPIPPCATRPRRSAARTASPIDLTAPPSRAPASAWPSYLIGLNARLSRLRASALPVARRPAVAAFVHTAFWRAAGGQDGPQQESYVGAVLDAMAAGGRDGDLFCVGVGPRRNFRTRRWWDPVTSRPARTRG